ncbi:MAG: NAD(P)/FAD-dependent oxidoreductase [Alphaproteobacteria bacterium]
MMRTMIALAPTGVDPRLPRTREAIAPTSAKPRPVNGNARDGTASAHHVRTTPPHVVIVGAGFGGLAAAQALARADVRVTIIDRRNHHLFQPLLYQVATAGLQPADITQPVRAVLRRQRHTQVHRDKVVGVDAKRRVVKLRKREISYDYLVLATGARHSYFGRDEWAERAPGLKSLEDATAIRRTILEAFEKAEFEDDPERRRRLLTFVLIGAGPTGVEMAGAIAELARKALASDFRTIDPSSARIVLVDAGPRPLAAFPARLGDEARRNLQDLGVEVRSNIRVNRIDDDGVQVGDEFIPAETIIWSAGVVASPAAQWLGVAADNAGRVQVGPDCSVPSRPEVFVIGDTAHYADAESGRPLPGVAPVAKQQGDFVGRLIGSLVKGRTERPRFRYRDWGSMATIGRSLAVCRFGRLQVIGTPAWLLWGAVHVLFLAGFRNRFAVAGSWLWAYVTFQRGVRLITGER